MAVPGLYTTVKNVSGAARVFGFLGAHGRRLENNETYTVPGDLVAALGKGGKGAQRSFQALERAIEDETLEILSSPAVYVLSEDEESADEPEGGEEEEGGGEEEEGGGEEPGPL